MAFALTPEALEWMSAHHGIITAKELAKNGVTEKARRHLVSIGTLVHEAKWVYRIASAPVTLEARCVIASSAHPAGFVTGPAGGTLLGLRRQPYTPRIHFCTRHGHELKLPGVHLRQSCAIDPKQDIHVRRDGIRVATPWRLAFDLAADLSDIDHRSVVEQMLHDGHCGIGALIAVGKRLAKPQRPGSARFVATMESRLPGAPLESDPEVRVAAALRERGVPVHAQATWLELPGGRRIRLDISVPDVRWGLEIDVHWSHRLQAGIAADRDRDRKGRRIGWQIDHVTEIDMLDFDAMIDEIVDLYELRCAEVALLDGRAPG